MKNDMDRVNSSESEAGSKTEAASSETGSGLSMDARFEILKNSRRRMVLKELQEVDEPVKLAHLADRVTALENDTVVSSITSSERKRVYVALYQFHLPKMAKMGVINYDQDRGDVSLTENGRALYQEHEDRTGSHRRWDWVSLALAGFGLVGIGLALLTQDWILATAVLTVQTVLLAGAGVAYTIGAWSEN